MTANTRVESVVFVARADSNETKEAFRSSLRVTEQAYLNEYGPIQGSSDQFVFSHLNPSAPFPRDGGVREYFSSLLEDVEADDNNLIIVLNDWDGLTIDSLTFVRMFEKYADRITIRAYVDDPRVFWEANVADMCKILKGEMDFEDTDPSTERFYRKFRAMSLLALRLKPDEREGMLIGYGFDEWDENR